MSRQNWASFVGFNMKYKIIGQVYILFDLTPEIFDISKRLIVDLCDF